MKFLTSTMDKISNILAVFSIICTFVLAIMYGCDIIGRLIFGKQLIGTFEIAQFLLCLITFLAFPYAQKVRSHIHVSFIVSKFPDRIKFVTSGIGFLFCACFCLIMVYAFYLQGSYAAGIKYSTVLRIPYEPMYYAASCLTFFFSLLLFMDAIRSFLAAAGNDEAKKEINRIFS